MNSKINLQKTFNNMPAEYQSEFNHIITKYPFKNTNYYNSLIKNEDLPNDPIFSQVYPNKKELQQSTIYTHPDPLNEDKQMPVANLIHRYKDRVVLLTTNACAVHCRFCLRKRKWNSEQEITKLTDKELSKVCEYLNTRSEIQEILISGGDPLMLSNDELGKIITNLSNVKSIKMLRLGTRIPVVSPSRIDTELVKILSSTNGLWVATHFNHPNELTKESLGACSLLISSGVPVINQTVLLKGINDDADILAKLFTELGANRIKPHYLFHIDPVEGNEHFATGIEKGIELLDKLRNRISSILTPVFAIDLPGGGGKVHLNPDYKIEYQSYKGINGEIFDYPTP
jgi:lysine 2,3-aminomutase